MGGRNAYIGERFDVLVFEVGGQQLDLLADTRSPYGVGAFAPLDPARRLRGTWCLMRRVIAVATAGLLVLGPAVGASEAQDDLLAGVNRHRIALDRRPVRAPRDDAPLATARRTDGRGW
jgi:hypothetical protein